MNKVKNKVLGGIVRTQVFSSIEGALRSCVSPEVMEEAEEILARSTVSAALAHMRVKVGISQKVMAAALGCSQPRISAIESARNDRASYAIILKYVEVTGVAFRAVLEDGRVVCVGLPRRKRVLA